MSTDSDQNACNAKGHDSGDDSDATHDSMPELVAVTPPRSPDRSTLRRPNPLRRPARGKIGEPTSPKPAIASRDAVDGQGALATLRRFGIIGEGGPLGRGLARLCKRKYESATGGYGNGGEAAVAAAEEEDEEARGAKRYQHRKLQANL